MVNQDEEGHNTGLSLLTLFNFPFYWEGFMAGFRYTQ